MTARKAGLVALALATSATGALAAGLERSAPSTRILFEEGRYIEFSSSFVSPDLSGSGGTLDPSSSGTGNLLESYFTFGTAYKADLTDQLSYALIFDQPYGVDTDYPVIATSGYSATTADLNAYQLTGIVKFEPAPGFHLYAGARAQSIDASASFGFIGGGYEVEAKQDFGFGYMGGVAYERPDIALRVALTYYSKIEHTHDTDEAFGGGAPTATETEITTPQSVNLEFQTGIAPDTLLFGSIHWVDWSDFSIEPPAFVGAVGSPLVDYEEDWITYTLGVGRRFNEQWSGAIQASFEPATDTTLTTLGPIDGRWSVGVAATYTMDKMKITGGISYVGLGEAENFAGTQYEDGYAIGAGLRVGYSF